MNYWVRKGTVLLSHSSAYFFFWYSLQQYPLPWVRCTPICFLSISENSTVGIYWLGLEFPDHLVPIPSLLSCGNTCNRQSMFFFFHPCLQPKIICMLSYGHCWMIARFLYPLFLFPRACYEVWTLQSECYGHVGYVTDTDTCTIFVDMYRIHRISIGF